MAIQTDGLITRSELALSPLAFTPANGYFIQRKAPAGFGKGFVHPVFVMRHIERVSQTSFIYFSQSFPLHWKVWS